VTDIREVRRPSRGKRWLFEDAVKASALQPLTRLTIRTIMDRADGDTGIVPAPFDALSLPELAAATGMSERAVSKHLDLATEQGWLVRQRSNGGRGKRNRYQLGLTKLQTPHQLRGLELPGATETPHEMRGLEAETPHEMRGLEAETPHEMRGQVVDLKEVDPKSIHLSGPGARSAAPAAPAQERERVECPRCERKDLKYLLPSGVCGYCDQANPAGRTHAKPVSRVEDMILFADERKPRYAPGSGPRLERGKYSTQLDL
jgi:hypothetical protein